MFKSFLMAGFECSALVKPCGTRLDLIEATNHSALAERDYAALSALGIRAARDGLRWHLIDRGQTYDWTSAQAQIEAAEAAGVKVIWDLNHYDCPKGVDIWSEEFVQRFAAYAQAAALHIVRNSSPPHHFCPVNEISFWAWAGGEQELFHPCASGRGPDLKRQLARAFIASAKAIREAAPDAVIIAAEPLIRVKSTPEQCGEAHHQSQFEALDMVLGEREPELGGSPEWLDAVGVNYYPFNQWYAYGPTIPFGHVDYQPLSDLLIGVYQRWGKPLLITETASEGSAKAAWLSYVVQEVLRAKRWGAVIEGVCLYPIISFPLWFTGQPSDAGLWTPDIRQHGHRGTDIRFRESIIEQSTKLRRDLGQNRFLLPFKRTLFGS
jgi:beta-glucosidase/6-phospho-beta-glucosidase/beta-galactosidase